MTIKLVFSINKEMFRITIQDKNIWYNDRFWKRAIRLIPKDKDFILKIIKSRNRLPNQLSNLFELTEREKREYENAKNDEELARICIYDIKSKGAILIKEERK